MPRLAARGRTGAGRPRRHAAAAGLALSLAAATLAQPQSAAGARPEGAPPNVLLVMTDDQGYGDIAAHGNPWIDTPVLDRLAAEGARCERFFVSPVCAPTRASLLTGRYHLRTGVHGVTRAQETMRSAEVTLAEALRASGYATGCFGKWHNGAHYPQHPNGQGFDTFFGFCAGHWNNYFDTGLERDGEPVATEGFMIDVLTDHALEFIGTHRDRPWFCYVPYNTPHTPWQVPDRYWDKYSKKGIGDPRAACAYAMCENIDDNLGRLLSGVDRLGLAGETIVVFLTDNGANTDRFNAGMKGRKGSLHEGGTRVPLFIRWPGKIAPGTVVKPITAHIDLFPTLLDLAGVAPPEGPALDGRSLVPLLRGGGARADWPERTLFTHWGGRLDPGRVDRGAARTERWRAVKYRRWELYDMVADPGQKQDLAAEHPEVLSRLSKAFEAWWQDVTAAGFEPVPTAVGHPARPSVTLPGHEAHLHPAAGKGISYVGRSGWANDWVTNWSDPLAYPSWAIDVVRPGRYEVALLYTCAADNVGTRLRVSAAGRSVEGTVDRAHDPDPLPSPDRIPRKEVYQKEWATLALGPLDLPAGPASLTVKTTARPGPGTIDLKAVRLRRTD